MTRKMQTCGLVVAALLAAAAAAPAEAAMECWNERQRAAAQVRDLQSRLMVATIRCQAAGIDITPAYNRFVVANRDTIRGANAVILAQFRTGYGEGAQDHYDRFATALANAYGADATDAEICHATETAAGEAADAAGDVARLVALDERMGAVPALPGGVCPISFAGTD